MNRVSRTKRVVAFGLWSLVSGLGSAFMGGCGEDSGYGGPGAVLLPSHIRSIAVRPIVNKTQIFGLEDRLRLRVEQEFLRDGRFPYVNNEAEADGVVVG